MTAYYNEHDPFAASWLRNLIRAGLIAPGDVDDRDIQNVQALDLRGYSQCHFFAGIGGWSLALRMARWPDDKPVWTGSCPCQPLSSAGKRHGHADERHLWPAFFGLISECRPTTVFGEQVASKDGREWLSGIRVDLEAVGYACGAADLCAAGVGAPHIRQRLYWVADANVTGECPNQRAIQQHDRAYSCWRSYNNRVGHSTGQGPQGQRHEYRQDAGRQISGRTGPAMQAGPARWNGPTIIAPCTDGPRRIPAEPALFPVADGISGRVGILRGSGNAIVPQVAAEFIAAFVECRP